jgi:hypothetical protein
MLIPGATTVPKAVVETSDKKPDYNMCSMHSCIIEYWCCKCQVATCKKCVSDEHYAHGQAPFENVVGQEVSYEKIESLLNEELGNSMKASLKDSVGLCEEELDVMEATQELESKLLSWKKHLLRQNKELSACMENVDSTSEISLKEKFDTFLKIRSRSDVEKASLLAEIRLVMMKLNALNKDFQVFINLTKALLVRDKKFFIDSSK